VALKKVISKLPHATAAAWELFQQLKLAPPGGAKVVIVPNNTWAFELRDECAIFFDRASLNVLPPLETDLLRNRGPSATRRVDRIRAACALAGLGQENGHTPIVFVPVASLLQPLLSKSFLTRHAQTLTMGATQDRDVLVDSLIHMGYVASELVEKPGDVAVRGSIVDVFSPQLDSPVRIEFDGDQIQSLRSFHPATQRRQQDLDAALLVPCREFVYGECDQNLLRGTLRAHLDDQDWIKADRDAFLARIEQQSYFATLDFWWRFFDEGERHWTEHFSIAAAVEPHTLQTDLMLASKEQTRDFETAKVEGEWVPSAQRFLEPLEAAQSALTRLLASADVGLSTRPSQDASSIVGIEATSHRMLANRQDPRELPMQAWADQLKTWDAEQTLVFFSGATLGSVERLNFLLAPYGTQFKETPTFCEAQAALTGGAMRAAFPQPLHDGFIDRDRKTVVLSDESIFGTRKKKSSRNSRSREREFKDAFSSDLSFLDLKTSDFVTHKEHGIGRYLGLKVLNFGGVPNELVEIEYRDGTKLFLPVTRLSLLQKHSAGSSDASLDKLGGQTWETKKSKVRKELRSIAGELLHLYSMRAMARGPEIRPKDSDIQAFAATFAYQETPDQEKAIEVCLKNLQGPQPMDRLLCGDVGYGKTEVALRAAHAVVSAGLQVAILAPTTILAAQHEATFKKRLGALGIRCEGLSRFKSTQEVKATLAAVADGAVQVVVGTHKVLGQDVKFKNLGLLVIDEEQRFGVGHKERIKQLRTNVHVLSMTATPIPRTLHLAMSGLKDLSIITTPPQDRLSVRTHIARKKSALVKEAIETELKRGGQVFYVHNRVQTMPKELEFLNPLLPPNTSVQFVHGQMNEDDIERRMIDFYEGRTQVLLTTAIIESGLDVPNANTLIVDRSDMFGLAQLYQLRGRVGRSTERGYAYLLIPEQGQITADAEERLAVLENYQELGSGFHIASHDLDIRGSGDILGRNQSGHVSALGFDAYVELLEEAISELKGEQLERTIEPDIKLDIDTTIPDGFVPEIGLRLMFYRKLSAASDEAEIDDIEKDLDDRFGSLPASVKNLVGVMKIKIALRKLGVTALSAGKAGFSVSFDSQTPVSAKKMVAAVSRYPKHFQVNPDGRLLIRRHDEMDGPEKMLRGIEIALKEVDSWRE
jgi:transcription-repair coupling factor (superfamily II helicase)